MIIDAPALAGLPGDGPLVVASSEPWPWTLDVSAGAARDDLRARVRLVAPARIARLTAAEPVGRWDLAARLDAAVQRAEVTSAEIGRELIWKAEGAGETTALSFESREPMPWASCHLRVLGELASWIRRGKEILDSWTFPEVLNDGRFVVEFDSGSGFGARIETTEPACTVPPDTLAMRVAQIGLDGRTGPWLSIGPGSPYL